MMATSLSGRGRAQYRARVAAASSPVPTEVDLPQPGCPKVEWLDYLCARWTFATADMAEQLHEFLHWCGWFGFSEDDRPEKVAGNVWTIRSSLTAPKEP
jgi:hypothetical protein